ncbi:MAG: hypothetical protein ACPHRO_03635, partial [Nannocystaceae bacterium]
MQVSRPRLSTFLVTLVCLAGCPTSSDTDAQSSVGDASTTVDNPVAPALPLSAETTGAPAGSDTAGDESGTTGGEESSSGEDGTTGEGTTGEVEEPWARPELPEGYGDLKFDAAAPSPEELTHHALAGYEVVVVYAEPKMSAKKLGFLRFGQRLRTTARISKEGCSKGWYGLEGGGFGCASKGLVVQSKPPYMHKPPPPAKMDSASPYNWAYVKKWNAPMWWRVPSDEEFVRASALRDSRESERTGEPLPGAESPPPPPPPAAEPEKTDT